MAGIAATIVVIAWQRSRCSSLDAFPTVGPTASGILGSWWAGFKLLTNAKHFIQEGYEKHKPLPFKVADEYSWIVVVSKHDHLKELRKAPEDVLSILEATDDKISATHAIVSVIRSQLTRNIGTLYSEMRDEIITVFDEVLDLRGNEWTSVSALSVIRNVICRASNRLFVREPLCQNPAWIDLTIQYTIDVVTSGAVIALFPQFVRPLAARFFPAAIRDVARGVKYLGPMIEERLKHLNENRGNWTEKPNDLISWLIEDAKGTELTVESLRPVYLPSVSRLFIQLPSFTQALFYLVANPQYIKPLREEVEAIVEKDGWSKAALGNMHKVDSFLKECQRMEGVLTLGAPRKAMRDFTFSDGTFIPEGAVVAIPTRCLHYDEKFYQNADIFDPFRFAEMQKVDGLGPKYQFSLTAVEYQAWGHGARACPGRFLAATIMKTMLAHIVTTYDIKLEDGAMHPRSLYLGGSVVPNSDAKVLFRRRVG